MANTISLKINDGVETSYSTFEEVFEAVRNDTTADAVYEILLSGEFESITIDEKSLGSETVKITGIDGTVIKQAVLGKTNGVSGDFSANVTFSNIDFADTPPAYVTGGDTPTSTIVEIKVISKNGSLKFEDCDFYTTGYDNTYRDNCNLVNMPSVSNGRYHVTFDGCEFSDGRIQYKANEDVNFLNCNFTDSPMNVTGGNDPGAYTIKGCTFVTNASEHYLDSADQTGSMYAIRFQNGSSDGCYLIEDCSFTFNNPENLKPASTDDCWAAIWTYKYNNAIGSEDLQCNNVNFSGYGDGVFAAASTTGKKTTEGHDGSTIAMIGSNVDPAATTGEVVVIYSETTGIYSNGEKISDIDSTVYVDSSYSENNVGEGMVFGLNAFASFTDALKAVGWGAGEINVSGGIIDNDSDENIVVDLKNNLTVRGVDQEANIVQINARVIDFRKHESVAGDVTLKFENFILDTLDTDTQILLGDSQNENYAIAVELDETSAIKGRVNVQVGVGCTVTMADGSFLYTESDALDVRGTLSVTGCIENVDDVTKEDLQVVPNYMKVDGGRAELDDTYMFAYSDIRVNNGGSFTANNSVVRVGMDYRAKNNETYWGEWESNPFTNYVGWVRVGAESNITLTGGSLMQVSGKSHTDSRSGSYSMRIIDKGSFNVEFGSVAEFNLGVDNGGIIEVNDATLKVATQFIPPPANQIANVALELNNSKTVKVISGTLEAGTVTNNGEFTVSSTDGKSSTLKIDTLTGNAIIAEDGAIIENSQVGGIVQVAGNVTFRGDNVFTWMTDCEENSADTASWTVEAGASLTLTQTKRFNFGFGDDITINGNIVSGGAAAARATLSDADADNDVKCSFSVNGLWAFSDNGYTADSTFTVNNAYVVIGKSHSFGHPSSNDPYSGGMIFNFNNSVLDSSRLTFYDQGIKTTFNLSGSDVRVGTFMTADQDSVFTLDNSTVLTNGTNTDRDKNLNAGTLNVKNSSDLTYTELFTNTGFVYVEKSALNAEDITNDKEIILNNAELDVAVLENNKDILVEGETTLNVGKDYLVDLTFGNIGTLSGEAVVRGLDSEGNTIAEYAVNLPKRATSHRFKGVKADRYVIYLGDTVINVTGVEYTNGGLKSGSNAIIAEDGTTLKDSTIKGVGIETNNYQYALSVNGDNAGTLYFEGENFIQSIDAKAGDKVVVKEGATLTMLKDGMKIGNGAEWEVNGSIAKGSAKSEGVADAIASGELKASLVTGDYFLSLDGSAADSVTTMNVNNAYVNGANVTFSNKTTAAGTFNVNYNNSYIAGKVFKLRAPTGDNTPVVNVTYTDSKLVVSANGDFNNYLATGTVTFDNTDAAYTRYFQNDGTVIVRNGANVTFANGSVTDAGNNSTPLGHNTGVIKVNGATLAITGNALDNSGTVKVSGDSTVSADFTGSGELVFDNGVLSDKIAVSGDQNTRFLGNSEINVTNMDNFQLKGKTYVGSMQTSDEAEEWLGSDKEQGASLSINSAFDTYTLWVGTRYNDGVKDDTTRAVVDINAEVTIDGVGINTTEGLVIRNSGVVNINDEGKLIVTNEDQVVVQGALNISGEMDVKSSGFQVYKNAAVTVSGGLLTLGGYNDTALRLGAVNESNDGNTVTRREDGAGYIRLENGAKLVLNEAFNIIHGEFVIDWSSCIEYNETITLNKYSNFGLNDGKFSIDYENFDKGTYLLMNYTGTGTALDYSKLVSNWSNDLVVFNGDLYISGADRSVIYVDASYTETGAVIGDKIVGVNAFSNINDAIKAMSDVTKTISVSGTVDGDWFFRASTDSDAFDYALNFQKTGDDEAVINAGADTNGKYWSYIFRDGLTVGEGVTLNLYDYNDSVPYANAVKFEPAEDKDVKLTVDGTFVYSCGDFGNFEDPVGTVTITVGKNGKMFAKGESNNTFLANSNLSVTGNGELQFISGSYTQFAGNVEFKDTAVRLWGTSAYYMSDAYVDAIGLGNATFASGMQGDKETEFKATNTRIEVVDGTVLRESGNEDADDFKWNAISFNKKSTLDNTAIYAGDMFILGNTVTMQNGSSVNLYANEFSTDNDYGNSNTYGKITVAEGAELNVTGSTIDVEGLDNAGSVIVTGESTLKVGKLSGGITFGSAAAASEITADIKEGSTGDIFIADESTVTLNGELATDGTIHNSVYDYADGMSKGYDLTIAEGANIRAAAIYISGGSEMTVKAGGKFGAFFTDADGFRDGTLNVYGSTLNVEKDAEVTTVANHVTGDLDIKGKYTATGINIYTAREGKRSGKVTVSGEGAVLDMTSNGTLKVGGSTVLDDKKYAAADEWKKAELVISDNAVVKVANALTNYNSEGRLYVYGNGIVTITGATLQAGYGIENYGSITVTDGIIESWKCDATANIPTVINSYDNAVFTVAGASSITVDAFNGNMDVAGTGTITISDIAGYVRLAEESSMDAVSYTGTLDAATAGTVTADAFSGTMNLSGTGIIDIDNFAGTMKVAGDVVLNAESDIDFTGSDDVVEIGSRFTFQLGDLEGVENWTAGEGAIVSITDVTLPANGSTVTVIAGKNNFTEENLIINSSNIVDGQIIIGEVTGGIVTGDVVYKIYDVIGDNETGWTVQEHIAVSEDDVYTPITLTVSSVTQAENSLNFTINADAEGGMGGINLTYIIDGVAQSGNTFTLTDLSQELVSVVVKATDQFGASTEMTQDLLVNVKDYIAPTLSEVSASETGWTNGDVTVFITGAKDNFDNGVSTWYSTDGGTTWQKYTDGVKFTENGTVLFKAIDAALNETAAEDIIKYEVNNIDKYAPVLTVDSNGYVSGSWTNKDVVISVSAEDDTAVTFSYSTDGGKTWTVYDGKDLTITESGDYIIKAADQFGQSSVSGVVEVRIDRVKPELSVDPNGYKSGVWTNESVVLNAFADDVNGLSRFQYSSDNGKTWTDYNGAALTVDASGDYIFKAVDTAGNETLSSVINVRIDKEPAGLLIEGNPTDWIETDSDKWPVKLFAAADEEGCLIEYNDFGSIWEKYDAAKGVTVYKNGTVIFRITDKAGNVSTHEVKVDKIWTGDITTPDRPGQEFEDKVVVSKKLDIKASTSEYANVTLETAAGNTAINIANGKLSSGSGIGYNKVEIGAITKADGAAGVNNIKIGNFAAVKVNGVVEDLGKLTVGKQSIVAVDGVLKGIAAKQNVKIAAKADVSFANIDLEGGKDTVTTGADSKFSADNIENVEKISVGARSDFDAGMISGVNKFKAANGAASNKTVINAGGISGLLGKNDTVSFGNYNTVRLDYKVDLLSGKDTLKIGKNSSFFAPEVSNVEIIKTSAGTDFFAEKVSGVNKFTASGSKTSSGYIEIMDLAGTAGNDTVSLGNYNDAFIGMVNLGAGNDQLKLGSNSELIVDVIDFGAGNDTLSIGKNSVVSVTEIKGMETLKGSKGSTLEINNGADTDVKFDSTLKGSWDKVTVLDDAGELALGDNGINVYANEWDVFEFASPESGKLTLESSDAVKFEYRFAGADNWLVYSEGSAIALNGNDLSIRVSVDLEDKKDKFAKFSASFKAELA